MKTQKDKSFKKSNSGANSPSKIINSESSPGKNLLIENLKKEYAAENVGYLNINKIDRGDYSDQKLDLHRRKFIKELKKRAISNKMINENLQE